MSDFFAELEEDIREERMVDLWNKYGNFVIGLALSIVIGTAAYVFWQHRAHKNQIRRQASFVQALHLMEKGNKEEAVKAFHALAEEGGGYGKLSQLYEASLLSNPEELYIKISQQNAADPALSKLPKVLIATRSLDKAEALKAIEPLTTLGNAWAPLSLELLALGHLKRGDQVEAAKLYIKMLKTAFLTPDEKLRAGMMLSQLDVPASLWEEETKNESQQ